MAAAAGITAAEAQADLLEMAQLLDKSSCSRRIRGELRAWQAAREEVASQTSGNSDVHSPSEAEADADEMAALLAGCRSARLRRELRPWCEARAREAASILAPAAVGASAGSADCAESERTEAAPGPAVDAAKSLPSIVVVGAAASSSAAGSACRLARALLAAPGAGAGDCEASASSAAAELKVDEATGMLTMETRLETKHYVARARCSALDIADSAERNGAAGGGAQSSRAAAVQEALRAADAVVLLWDSSEQDSFARVRSLYENACPAPEDADAEEEEERDRVLLCVAADEGAPDGEGDDGGGEDFDFCMDRGFEPIRCALDDASLRDARARFLGAPEGSGGSLLESDVDGTAGRIVEALLCHVWPGLQRKQAMAGAASADDGASTAEKEGALVVVLGPRRAGGRELVRALADGAVSPSVPPFNSLGARMELRTRYYSASLRLLAADSEDVRAAEAEAASCGAAAATGLPLHTAAGVILVFDAADAATFDAVRELYEHTESGGASGSSSSAGVRLCVAAAAACGTAGVPEPKLQERAETWCAENGFEFLACALDEPAFDSLRRGREEASRAPEARKGASLLRGGSGAEATGAVLAPATRILEALESHVWPGMRPRDGAGDPPLTCSIGGPASTAAAGGAATAAAKEAKVTRPVASAAGTATGAAGVPGAAGGGGGGDNLGVEALDQLADEIRKVRSMDDGERRRDRAMEVALQMARSMGLENDSDSDCG
eukprot:TRINITY_DN10410_c0_g2_i3.p1 TRINITY_DN10410_c0_g2~~TRINITY_DN10410_c0_g2_i3.p1  ORF type:complete len:731 (-),score=211.68 TRINITY_DN10410_c0_g2_i3:30-2222(-)